MTGEPPADPIPALAADTGVVALNDPVFISDLHLSEAQPATVGRFLRFAREVAVAHSELVILGDLFEYWAGDDDLDAGVGRTVAEALRALAGQGVAVFVMHGNRDLLLGRGFARAAHAALLADPTRATLPDGAVLLAHGDAYCTLDTEYQRFRAQVRDPDWQRGFLAQPLDERRAFIGAARAASASVKKTKPTEIMDVTPAAIDTALRAAGVTTMIHGHTHRPAAHRWTLDGRTAERWVLPDWDFDAAPARGGYVARTARGLCAIDLAG
ncbi:MAG: UDP-2,3-diacylglucosamine diphosphatase [Pseudomonadota bacterium]